MIEVKAHNRNLRMSPQKVRLVVDIVRGMDVAPAIDQMKYIHKAAARPVRKLIESAVANAKHNDGIESDNLFIKSITVNDGPTLKRSMPRAMGSSGMIRKRSSHITVILAPKDESKVAKKVEKTEETKEEEKKVAKKEEPASSTDEGKDEKKPAKKPASEKK